MNIALLSDSFPPLIDGVANTVANYAEVLNKKDNNAVVYTPFHPEADDSWFDFDVVRYPGLDLRKQTGYIAGNPFSYEVGKAIKKNNTEIIHSHSPFSSTFLARTMAQPLNVPVIMTYHTKFDIDIANVVRGKLLQSNAIGAMVSNISSCDEIWAVNQGAADNLHSLGYEGDIIIMKNGVDIPKGRLNDDEIAKYTSSDNLPSNVPVFLFVGRLMWYKGIKYILEAIKALSSMNYDYRMVFIGNNGDENEIKAYTKELGLSDKVIFKGAIYERKELSAWYCRADLLILPSSFDNNPLVVREAAACSLPAVLIKGSSPAEGIENMESGFLIEENAASLAVCLSSLIEHPEKLEKVKSQVADKIYVSWEDSISEAYKRYEIVLENHKSGKYKKHFRPSDEFFKIQGEMISAFSKLNDMQPIISKPHDRYK